MIGNKYYTGVGSRETPEDILKLMREIGRKLAQGGFVLRSGGAGGADTAFELGCDSGSGDKEIYIPWKGFSPHGLIAKGYSTYNVAQQIAAEIHPAWERCTEGVKALHTRNVYQVLGADLKTPSQFLICWAVPTKTGVKGGTNTAVQLALKYGVKVFNLYDDHTRERLERWVKLYEQP